TVSTSGTKSALHKQYCMPQKSSLTLLLSYSPCFNK
ncbi:hypothetical protein A2U01_0097991, partial [Trifolium medium]|nr:hypothetical protein [Trifolium medium]